MSDKTPGALRIKWGHHYSDSPGRLTVPSHGTLLYVYYMWQSSVLCWQTDIDVQFLVEHIDSICLKRRHSCSEKKYNLILYHVLR